MLLTAAFAWRAPWR